MLGAFCMSKFTIFTIILSISAITIMADLIMRDYAAKDVQTSIVTSDSEPAAPIAAASAVNVPTSSAPVTITPAPTAPAQTAPVAVTPPPAPVVPTPPVAIAASRPTVTGTIIQQAGFLGDFQEQPFSGKLYELLDITKTPIESVGFYQITDNGVTIASVTEIALRDEIRALQMYSLLQNKTKPYIDLTLNETNAYGDHSFYVNHAKKPDEAFLTVKIGRMIYGFAYVKSYHPQLKKLISLLSQ